MGPEKQFENKIKSIIRKAGGWCFKYWGGSASNGKVFTVRGLPDIMGCIRGRFIGIEVKSETGKPSDIQLERLQEIRDAGGVAIVAFPQEEDLIVWMINRLSAGQDVTDLQREINEVARTHYDKKGQKNRSVSPKRNGGVLQGPDRE